MEFNEQKHYYGESGIGATVNAIAFAFFTAGNVLTLGVLGKCVYGDDIFSYNLSRRVKESAFMLRQILPIATGCDIKTQKVANRINNLESRITRTPFWCPSSNNNTIVIWVNSNGSSNSGWNFPVATFLAECLKDGANKVLDAGKYFVDETGNIIQNARKGASKLSETFNFDGLKNNANGLMEGVIQVGNDSFNVMNGAFEWGGHACTILSNVDLSGAAQAGGTLFQVGEVFIQIVAGIANAL